jgi:hypothetical protein
MTQWLPTNKTMSWWQRIHPERSEHLAATVAKHPLATTTGNICQERALTLSAACAKEGGGPKSQWRQTHPPGIPLTAKHPPGKKRRRPAAKHPQGERPRHTRQQNICQKEASDNGGKASARETNDDQVSTMEIVIAAKHPL